MTKAEKIIYQDEITQLLVESNWLNETLRQLYERQRELSTLVQDQESDYQRYVYYGEESDKIIDQGVAVSRETMLTSYLLQRSELGSKLTLAALEELKEVRTKIQETERALVISKSKMNAALLLREVRNGQRAPETLNRFSEQVRVQYPEVTLFLASLGWATDSDEV